MESFIKGYHVYKDVWSPKLLEVLTAASEPNNIVDKYAVCVCYVAVKLLGTW